MQNGDRFSWRWQEKQIRGEGKEAKMWSKVNGRRVEKESKRRSIVSIIENAKIFREDLGGPEKDQFVCCSCREARFLVQFTSWLLVSFVTSM